jgi:Cytochrome c554 and c-prime
VLATWPPSLRAASLAALLMSGASCKQAPPSAEGGANRGQGPSAAAPTLAEAAASHAVLVFAASQAGQLVPCGCSPDQRGGLPRAGALLDRMREKDPTLVYVDAGDALLASAAPPSGPAAGQAELKARTLAKADALLGAATRVLGARDLALGPGFAAETAEGVPLLDAGGPPVPGARATLRVEPGGVPVGIFAAGLGEAPEQTIAARAAQLRADGARVLVLVVHPHGDRALSAAEALLPAARAAGVDLVVLGRRDDPATDPARVDPTAPPLFALEGHGQELLRIDLSVPRDAPPGAPLFLARGASGKAEELKELDDRIALLQERAAQAPPAMRELLDAKVRDLLARRAAAAGAVETPPAHAIVATATFLPLAKDVGEAPRLKALIDAYDARVAELNLAAARKLPASCPRAAPGEAAYMGVSAKVAAGESCATCHATEADFWRRTAHAHAYQTLVDAKKQFSLDCIQCHVTGWQQPGGVCRIDRTAAGGPGLAAGGGVFGRGRRDVQCEMCHGPASLHAEAPPGDIQLEVPEQTCKRCHEVENSPRFSYARYRPWIVGPGHGEPLAKGAAPRSRGEIDGRGARGPNDPAKPTP